jgi:hypothetical protein
MCTSLLNLGGGKKSASHGLLYGDVPAGAIAQEKNLVCRTLKLYSLIHIRFFIYRFTIL